MRKDTNNPYGIVYQIYCVPSGKSYVGQTIRTLGERWRQHQKLHSDCHGVRGAIAKYGVDSFSLKVLDTGTNKADLDAKETLWIQHLGTVSPAGYNLTGEGKGHGPPSDETRARMRQAKLAVAQTSEFKEAMSLAGRGNKGKKKSPEHAAKVATSTAATRALRGGSFTKGMTYKTRADKGTKRPPGTGDKVWAGRRAAAKARRESEGTL